MNIVYIDILENYLQKRLNDLQEYKQILIRRNQPHDYYTGMIEALAEVLGLLKSTKTIE